MSSDDLEMVLAWRNHHDIRRYMLNDDLIGLDEHRAWFCRASSDPSRILLIIEENLLPLGFVQFADIDSRGVAEWGFYVRPDAPKGSGRKLAFCALRYVFEKVGLQKVCGRVLGKNIASIAFHKKIGFTQEDFLSVDELGGGFSDCMVVFGLNRCDWDPRQLMSDKNANN